MDDKTEKLSRRDFLKLSATAAGALILPKRKIPDEDTPHPENSWPKLTLENLPQGEIKEALEQVPNILLDSDGYLTSEGQRVPFWETDWSRDNRRIINPDALVVHWNGHPDPGEAIIRGIVSGYNQERTHTELGYDYVTSAHATIGPYSLDEEHSSERESHISILQSQTPREGMPTISSHIRSNLDREREAYRNARHPINAMQMLLPFYGLPRTYNFLPNTLRGSGEDVNFRTISLELVGDNFDTEAGHPNPQLIANSLGTILAYMNKYPDIKFANILGHYEIQLDKADPGKKFMGELRFLLALKILTGNSRRLKENFFGPFMSESGNLNEAVKRFFDFHWDLMVASNWGHPKKVLEWEKQTGYWTIYKNLFPEGQPDVAERFVFPVRPTGDREIRYGNRFGNPEYHEGLDINATSEGRVLNEDLGDPVYAAATGKVVFAGEIPGKPGLGKTMVLEHLLPDGGKVLSLYAHLEQIEVTKDQFVELDQPVAKLGNSGNQLDSHLHFAIMPAGSRREWELAVYLQRSYAGEEVAPHDEDATGRIYVVPSTVGRSFLESYYFDPLNFIPGNI